MTITRERSVQVAGRRFPVVLPNRRDARLHTAAVIISLHVVGITALGFTVSVPQIATAMLTAGLIDTVLTLRRTGKLVWPASGLLTGSGVGLILRLSGMSAGDYWSWDGWYWFGLVAALSVLTKFYIRFREQHLFNPSNIGLVIAFLVLGSGLVEPLDFWWAPLGLWMIVAYVLIIGGGVVITRRLALLEMAVSFWVVLAVGLGVLAASGHCMIASWSPTPVCDGRFWTVLVTSPEILIFLFFMITDPKTIPTGRTARAVFAASLGVLTTLMIAPHTLEYGAKVGLLASLALWSPLRWAFDHYVAELGIDRSGLGGIRRRLRDAAPGSAFIRGMASGAALVILAVGVVVAGVPARETAVATAAQETDLAIEVDAATLPEVDVDSSVRGLDVEVDDEFVDLLSLTLAENLAIEGEAMRTADGSLLGAADGGERLDEMQARLDEAIATGDRWVDEYEFDSLSLSLHESAGGQTSAGLIFHAKGTVDRVLYDALGVEKVWTSETFDSTFLLRQLGSDRWLLVAVDTVVG